MYKPNMLYFLFSYVIYILYYIILFNNKIPLNRYLYNFGYKIKGSKDNIHPKAFSSILEEVKGKDEEKAKVDVANKILNGTEQ